MIPPPPRSSLFPYTTLFRSYIKCDLWRIGCADRALGCKEESLSQQGEAGPHGCFFALVEEAGREDERGRAVQAPSGFVAVGLITGMSSFRFLRIARPELLIA